jgi:nucleotide-binding universal stress UspA family protein
MPDRETAQVSKPTPTGLWPTRVLVGVDGRDRSADAVALGCLLASATGASLLIACIYGSRPRFQSIETAAEAQQAIDHASEVLDGRYAAPPHPVVDSSPGNGLRRLAAEESADLIVVGSSHRSGFGRILPGAVGDHLLQDLVERQATFAVLTTARSFASSALWLRQAM